MSNNACGAQIRQTCDPAFCASGTVISSASLKYHVETIINLNEVLCIGSIVRPACGSCILAETSPRHATFCDIWSCILVAPVQTSSLLKALEGDGSNVLLR